MIKMFDKHYKKMVNDIERKIISNEFLILPFRVNENTYGFNIKGKDGLSLFSILIFKIKIFKIFNKRVYLFRNYKNYNQKIIFDYNQVLQQIDNYFRGE